jgi:hypothetical protein
MKDNGIFVTRKNRQFAIKVVAFAFLYFAASLCLTIIVDIHNIICWLVVAMAAIQVVVAIWILFATEYVELGRNQFVVCTAFQRICHAWTDVVDFGAWGFGPIKRIGYRFRDPTERGKPRRRLNRMITGFDESFPDIFEKRANELQQLMSDWHSGARESPVE